VNDPGLFRSKVITQSYRRTQSGTMALSGPLNSRYESLDHLFQPHWKSGVRR